MGVTTLGLALKGQADKSWLGEQWQGSRSGLKPLCISVWLSCMIAILMHPDAY